ncbi:MAG TPA: YceI family protein [Cryptosporangiaceae bacterium]|nr:YceI family protein [Cryptosporangiaceae bacterium]
MTRYALVPERSALTAQARSNVHPIHGEGRGLTGWVDVEVVDGRLDPASKPAVHIELDTDRLKAENSLYDREIQKRINARRYPTIRGDVREVRETAPGQFEVAGELSFNGATKPVDGTAKVSVVDDRTLRVEGDLTVDIRDFGLEPPKILMLKVFPDVAVHVDLVAEREGTSG